MITVVDDPSRLMDVQSFETVDDAIAEAIRQLDGDGVVAIHAADCEIDRDDESTCTCVPLELELGAKA